MPPVKVDRIGQLFLSSPASSSTSRELFQPNFSSSAGPTESFETVAKARVRVIDSGSKGKCGSGSFGCGGEVWGFNEVCELVENMGAANSPLFCGWEIPAAPSLLPSTCTMSCVTLAWRNYDWVDSKIIILQR